MISSLDGNVDRLVDQIMSSGTDDVLYRDKFLRDDTIKKLCDMLKIQPKKKLILRGNFIAASGAEAIADVVASQDSLAELSLEWNQLGTNGAIYFAKALKTNRSIVTLDLKNNNIGSDGAVALSEALMENPVLRSLDLRWNKVSRERILF
jgi:Ran GTPase-activating protein (RanGAP) involved in mRNA processing and transport